MHTQNYRSQADRDNRRAEWRALDRRLVGIAVVHVKDMRANCQPNIWDEKFWIDMIKSFRESHSISIKCEQLRRRAQ